MPSSTTIFVATAIFASVQAVPILDARTGFDFTADTLSSVSFICTADETLSAVSATDCSDSSITWQYQGRASPGSSCGIHDAYGIGKVSQYKVDLYSNESCNVYIDTSCLISSDTIDFETDVLLNLKTKASEQCFGQSSTSTKAVGTYTVGSYTVQVAVQGNSK